MGNFLKKFCGKFEDKHQENDTEDIENGEEGGMLPKDYDRIKKELLKPQGVSAWFGKLKPPVNLDDAGAMGGDAMAVKGWLKYQTTTNVETVDKGGAISSRFLDAIIVKEEKIRPAMLKKLRTFQTLHTIDIVCCSLKEIPGNLTDIDGLRVLRLSRNLLKCVRRDLTCSSSNKYSSLHRVILNENRIDTIELGTFGQEAVKEMVVLNFGKNLLTVLPIDFCMKAPCLEILDLSFNKLISLPECIMECTQLRILDVCNNQLKSLPEHMDKLKKLRKLFVNSNFLNEIPEKIGGCREMEKLWVSDNNLRYLPQSLIPLWHTQEPEPGQLQGVLEEIMVDDNPLVVPSVTAFSMGGADQMFRLFKEFVVEEKRRKEDQERLALTMGEDGEAQLAVRDGSAQLALGDVDEGIPGEEGHAASLRANADTAASAHEAPEEDDAYAADGDDERQDAEPEKETKTKEPDFYFESCKGDYDAVSKIRSAESSMMLLKRHIFADQLKELAHKRAEEARKHGQKLPKKIVKYQEDSFDAASYKGSVHVSDLDLYFCLFVIAAKPLCATCEQLYHKFSPHGEMDRKSWDTFCARVPAKLPEEVKSTMWKLMSWRSREQDGASVGQVDFTAAMHIHDIALQDPFISRISQVLKLRYYSIPMDEFTIKIRRRGNDTANALESIDFPSSDEDPADEEDVVDVPVGGEGDFPEHENVEETEDQDKINTLEGERQMAHSNQNALLLTATGKAKDEGKKKKAMISMSEAQYCQIHNSADADESDDAEDVPTAQELSSDELSLPDASDSEFDADDCLEVLEKLEQEKVAAARKEVPQQQFRIKADTDLDKLMSLPVSSVVGAAQQEYVAPMNDDSAANLKKEKAMKEREKKRQKQMAGATMVRDPRFGTNIMVVRRALRDAYRNLPYNDFVALVNFLLRGLKRIKHFDATVHLTYWHADDPVVRHLLGEHDTNKYPTEVLRAMGFVCVLNSYWVWPDKHLRGLGKSMDRLVDAHCPGREKMRLDDLIKLIQHCKKSLDKAGRKFTGHCRDAK